MKTTILLCALAALAAAIPTNHHNVLQEQELAQVSDALQREKKSHHEHHGTGLSTEAGTENKQIQSISNLGHKLSSMEGRSLGFKKPIIVKKKIGYHVYRDSDEEMAHAEPHENCRNQVKVKICDEPGSPTSVGACFVSDRNEDTSEKEIENSIKTAKEAVEKLQRGFNKMEHNSAKFANTEDIDLEDDLAVHRHIEAARKALEHVQQNFGNLESLNLQASSPKSEDFQLKSQEEKRLAQWKEAIDNIQKNVEIARNIEDAFKAESEQTNLSPHTDENSKLRESHHIETETETDPKHNSAPTSSNNVELISDESDATKQRESSDTDMFTAPTEQKELKIKLHSESLRSEKMSDESGADHDTEHIETESNPHAPTVKNSETTDLSDGSLKADSIDTIEHVNDQQTKAASENIETLEGNVHDMTLKTEKDALPDMEDTSSLPKETSADELHLAKSAHIENVENPTTTTKHQEHDMSMDASHISQHHAEMKHSIDNDLTKKMAIPNELQIDQSLKPKSIPEVDEHLNEEKLEFNGHTHNFHERMTHEQENTKHIESTPVTVTRFTNGLQNINENLMRMFEDQNMEHKSNEMQSTNEHGITDMQMSEDQKFQALLMRLANENQQRAEEASLLEDLSESTKMSDFSNGQHFQHVHPSMRSNQEHITEHHLNENQGHASTHWGHEKHQTPLHTSKAANEFHDMNWNQRQNMQNHVTEDHNLHNLFLMRLAQEKQQNEHLQNEFHKGHSHDALSHNRFSNNLANGHDMSNLGPRMNERFHAMNHVMASDMESASAMQPSMHMSMRDSHGKPLMEQKDMHFNHHHHHAMARYGSGLPVSSASSGAVGLFPNANPGGCGIPLMLSCSPNVVSGTLAKSQSHTGAITAPAYRSGDDFMYYMKRDAKDTDELPALKIQKTSVPFHHKEELIFDKSQ